MVGHQWQAVGDLRHLEGQVANHLHSRHPAAAGDCRQLVALHPTLDVLPLFTTVLDVLLLPWHQINSDLLLELPMPPIILDLLLIPVPPIFLDLLQVPLLLIIPTQSGTFLG